QPVWLVHQMRMAIGTLLSGSLLPLAYYPWGLGELFSWLPFASTAWAPLAIFTGAGDPLRLLLVQVGWVVVLWPLTYWRWAANGEKVVGYGGYRSPRVSAMGTVCAARHVVCAAWSTDRPELLCFRPHPGHGGSDRDVPARAALRRHPAVVPRPDVVPARLRAAGTRHDRRVLQLQHLVHQ